MYASSDSFRASGFEMNSRARNKKWGKTFNSAILEDTAVQSVYMDQYIAAAKKAEAARLGRDLTSDENKRIEKAFGEYGEMKIGDAQGWITFDSYRALLVSLGKWSNGRDAYAMTVVQLLMCTLLSALASVAEGGYSPPPDWGVWATVIFTAVVSTAIAFVIQTWAQAHMTTTKVAVILTMEVVFAAIFAIIFGGERLTAQVALGGILVVTAMYVIVIKES